ncbi:MAG TPA: magnesium protoporphyrin IX methyltransferase [Sandaracinaceae bacterium LLY-WYZ-13_1]|nr:magnesium protoporphyrin IX methyltransferase [Sandaracinaceae bacterium LLY-WYZ-13_1]
MQTATYTDRRAQLEEYFDRTAATTWARITSDEPVGRIRATVREGRDRMRETLLSYLPDDLSGQRVLDAGCGTGAFAVEAAQRGADVVAVDVSPTLITLARQRTTLVLDEGRVDFRVGDMSDASLGTFDWVVAMDSFIHYQATDLLALVSGLAVRTRRGLLFTFAPRTPLLSLMHTVGKVFPRGARSPDIVPIGEETLRRALEHHEAASGFTVGRSERIQRGFYTSQTMELARR